MCNGELDFWEFEVTVRSCYGKTCTIPIALNKDYFPTEEQARREAVHQFSEEDFLRPDRGQVLKIGTVRTGTVEL